MAGTVRSTIRQQVTAVIAVFVMVAVVNTVSYSLGWRAGTKQIEQQRYDKLQHGCVMLAMVSRTRADTVATIKQCAEWEVAQPFIIVNPRRRS